MTKVVKIGGVLLQDPTKAVATIREMVADRTIVVHGGGVQITRMLEQMDIRSVFVEGLRVTDEDTLRGVAAALLGEVHASLVEEFRKQGTAAIGVFGAVSAIMKAGPWGLVGANVRADGKVLDAILAAGHIPVVPTLAVAENSLLNVNGDETAAAVALAARCEELVFLTDVEGVKDGRGDVIAHSDDPGALLTASFVSGGMIPKLRAVKAALDGGIRRVRVGRTLFGDLS